MNPELNVGNNVQVTIQRNPPDTFEGKVIGETTTHWRITHKENKDEGELFAKNCDRVQFVRL